MVYTLTCLCGLTVYAYYADKGCDPLRNKEIASSNQLLPHFIMEVVNYPGLPGVFLAVLFSGALRFVPIWFKVRVIDVFCVFFLN